MAVGHGAGACGLPLKFQSLLLLLTLCPWLRSLRVIVQRLLVEPCAVWHVAPLLPRLTTEQIALNM